MEQYKSEFIEFMVDCQVLRFGDFVTKSGRKTPFFINTGFYRTGGQLRKLGFYYGKAIKENFGRDFDVLFGPAYKGIPLSVATSMALNELYDVNIGYCSNRKEEKDHGDVGILLGTPLDKESRVLMIEDVTTSGKSIRETMPVLKGLGVKDVRGLIVSVDRMERGTGSAGALEEIGQTYNMKTTAIVTMKEIVEHLYNKPYKGRIIIDDEIMKSIDAYYEKYGI